MKIIGERLRSLRESVRLSQAKLAKEFDVSQSALARYEIDDSTPCPEVFLKYADYFDVSLDYIFGRTDDPHGMIYNNCVKLGLNNPEMARFFSRYTHSLVRSIVAGMKSGLFAIRLFHCSTTLSHSEFCKYCVCVP